MAGQELGDNGQAFAIDVDSGQLSWLAEIGGLAAWSPDDRLLAHDDNGLRFLDAATGLPIGEDARGHEGASALLWGMRGDTPDWRPWCVRTTTPEWSRASSFTTTAGTVSASTSRPWNRGSPTSAPGPGRRPVRRAPA
ncbi:hypothetical protein SAZ11_38890 [Streptomyces sp. FXJ1.4098]|nr:hypothetical protein [Streptomyces sp. FXJ1.4098]